MTVASTTRRSDAVGSGVTKTYSYGFRILDDDDLLVSVQDTNGVITSLTKTVDYTVTGVGVYAGGTIVLVNAGQAWLDTDGDLKTNYKITVRRRLPLTQDTDLRNSGDFYPEDHETQFDRFAMVDLQQQDELDRAIKFPETDSPALSATLPASSVRSNRYLAFDATGNVIASGGGPGAVPVSAFMETVLDDANAQAARTTLGATSVGDAVYVAANAAAGRTAIGAVGSTDLADTSSAALGDALVGGKRTDAAASAFTIHSFNENRPIDIKTDYGCVGDGATDNRVKFLSAYAAAKAGGRGLYIPKGDFLVAQDAATGWSLLLDGDVLLRGEGPESRILGNGDYALIRVSESGTTDRIDISDLRFDNAGTGSFAAENQQWCLRIHKAAKSVKISRCTFENFNEDAIYLGFNASVLVNDAIITGNHFKNGGRTGVALISVNGFLIADNIFDDIDFQPIDVEPDVNTYSALNGIIKSNIIRGGGGATFASTRAAIGVNHKTGAAAAVVGKIVVDGNVIVGYGATAGANLAHGIQTNFQNKLAIKNNVIVDAKDRGINVQDTTDALVMGNAVTGGVNGLVINNCTRIYEGPNYFQGQSGAARSFTSSTGLSLAANLAQSNQEFYKDGAFVAETFGGNGLLSEKSILIKDGIAAPGATSGYATLYVDTADGDLKVVFGDGVVKTIVVDT